MTERQPPDDEPEDDENPEFDRFEELTKKLLGASDEAEDSGHEHTWVLVPATLSKPAYFLCPCGQTKPA